MAGSNRPTAADGIRMSDDDDQFLAQLRHAVGIKQNG